MGTENQLVKVEHLYKEFDAETKVLSDINLTINKNEVIAILGPSGTGKSTLLRCLNYLTVPTKGKITIGDVTVDAEHHTKKDVIELRKHSSMVFQGYNLFKNKTAIFISHRLASTQFCDRIFYMQSGQILEVGTHDELLALNGEYKRLYDVQSQYYRSDGGDAK